MKKRPIIRNSILTLLILLKIDCISLYRKKIYIIIEEQSKRANKPINILRWNVIKLIRDKKVNKKEKIIITLIIINNSFVMFLDRGEIFMIVRPQ